MKKTNTIFFYNDKKAVQSQIYIVVDGEVMDLNDRHRSNVFNKYFGGSMSGLVFQEIRESKALAYSVYSTYTLPKDTNDSHYLMSYIGTQVDKLEEAILLQSELLNF